MLFKGAYKDLYKSIFIAPNKIKYIIMKQIDIKEFNENVIELIGKEWMLITAGREGDYNTMTASWGTVGFLWGKPVINVFIRPQRHTFGFIEREDRFTVTFFKTELHKVLEICGKKSGRDTDKAELCGITPIYPSLDTVSFKEARLIIECKKLYKTELKGCDFIDSDIEPRWYKGGDFHYQYTAEIEAIYITED